MTLAVEKVRIATVMKIIIVNLVPKEKINKHRVKVRKVILGKHLLLPLAKVGIEKRILDNKIVVCIIVLVMTMHDVQANKPILVRVMLPLEGIVVDSNVVPFGVLVDKEVHSLIMVNFVVCVVQHLVLIRDMQDSKIIATRI